MGIAPGWIATIAFFAAAASVAAADPVPSPRLSVHIGGRVAAGARGYRAGWPGVYFEARFQGPAVEAAVDPAGERFAVLVDGVRRSFVQQDGVQRLSFSDLGPGEHLIRLQKETQSESVPEFLGFTAGEATVPLEPPRRARQMEVIGDSYSVGYGDLSTTRACTPREVHDRTDTALAFGPLLAARFDADYRINAYSGLGMVRNYNGGRPGFSIRTVYPRLIPDAPEPLDPGPSGWRPQLIVIEIGTNDFSTPLHAGEPWKDREALGADYRARYVEFARDVMRAQPQARLVLMAAQDFAGDVRQVAAALDPSQNRVRVLVYAGLELTGCNWHPSMRDQSALGDSLGRVIEGIPDP
jgi:lysophospholipase L1-like esterase